MRTKEITIAGLWGFAIIALLGGIFGALDGLAVLMFFIVAVVVSVGLAVMPASEAGELKRGGSQGRVQGLSLRPASDGTEREID